MLATQTVDAFSRCVSSKPQEVWSGERITETLTECLSSGRTVVAVYLDDTVQFVLIDTKQTANQQVL